MINLKKLSLVFIITLLLAQIIFADVKHDEDIDYIMQKCKLDLHLKSGLSLDLQKDDSDWTQAQIKVYISFSRKITTRQYHCINKDYFKQKEELEYIMKKCNLRQNHRPWLDFYLDSDITKTDLHERAFKEVFEHHSACISNAERRLAVEKI